MCGVAGAWDPHGRLDYELCARQISDALPHRGPDAEGLWIDRSAGLALAHRRLSIVDLSATGAQPMMSASGRYVISYNGEIYNTDELRQHLSNSGISFRGNSDTEIVVNAIDAWGLERAIVHLNGIFAFAVWDRATRTLSLCRDRLGVKPLFWSRCRGGVIFSSELRGLASVPEFDQAVDPDAVRMLLQRNYIQAPSTIYRSARSIEAGSVLHFHEKGAERIWRYWNLSDVVTAGAAARTGTAAESSLDLENLQSLLDDAISRQMIADVPLGAFLSGGIDSSTVVASMQRSTGVPVRTFSIGFDGSDDEAAHAREVARHLGTHHTELRVDETLALKHLPTLAAGADQPLADQSAVPTFLLSKLAREHVTVALSGDGGDELFYGYDRYIRASRVQQGLRRVPRIVRMAGSATIATFLGGYLDREGLAATKAIGRRGWQAARLIDFAANEVADSYLHFITQWHEHGSRPADAELWEAGRSATSSPQEHMMFHDTRTYLTDCVLAKVDRMSMANSLEVRVPLLDHRIVELAWRLPMAVKYRGGVGKWCLRQLLYGRVPQQLIDRPKAGFRAPLASWLRGGLREWADHLLSPNTLQRHGLVDVQAVRRLWLAHLGGMDTSGPLSSILMLHGWLEGRDDAVDVGRRNTAGSRAS